MLWALLEEDRTAFSMILERRSTLNPPNQKKEWTMKRIAVLSLATISLAVAASETIKLTINGKPAENAIVVNGKTYIPLDALEKAGVRSSRAGVGLSITLPGSGAPPASSPPATGGTLERASLEGCVGETLFNGVWRVKVLKLEPIKKDADTPGWGLTLEVRNGTKATLIMPDAGVDGTGQGIQLAFADASTLSVDPLEVQKLTFASLPPGGAVTQQLTFYYPFGTSADAVKTPTKFLLEVNPKGIGDSTRAKGVAFSVPNPSLRVRLDCQK
jgi:hypothetical protein